MTPDIGRLCELVAGKTGRNFDHAPAYAEPGYTDPDKCIVFGNWNPACGFSVPKEQQRRDPVAKLARILEKCGCELEWEDEWTTCQECGKAVRTSPDSYGWTSYYRVLNECELICLDCLDWADYLEGIEDNARQACPPEIKPADYGYIKVEETFETGFHPGQTDDPAKVLKQLHEQGKSGVVFRLASKGQFDLTWEAYYKA